MEIVNNKNTYKKLDKNMDSSIMNKINDSTREHETELTKKNIKHQSSQLDGLTKIYKNNLAIYKWDWLLLETVSQVVSVVLLMSY